MIDITDTARPSVEFLFEARTIAVLGASNDERKYGNWLSVQALQMEETHTVHLVNHNGTEVLGRPTLRRLAEATDPIDLVVICVPAAAFEEAVEDSLSAGARAIVGVTAGFAELGREGKRLQDRVARRVRNAGAVLLGPNCMGVLDTIAGVTLSSNPLPPGTVSLISQSGNMALELSQFFETHGLGFARFASLGNQADLKASDLIRSCAHHEGTEIIAVYAEDFGDGRDFVEAASTAREAGKPVILLTVGDSEASIRGAQSHTGSLTSNSAVIDAACKDAGVYRVHTPRELANLAALLTTVGPHATVDSVAIIADGGGHASIAADTANRVDLNVPEFRAGTQHQLIEQLPPSASVTNPIDIAGAGEQDIASFARVLEIALRDEDTDSVFLTGFFGGYGQYGPELARGEIETAAEMAHIAQSYNKPVVVHTMYSGSPAAQVLVDNGVPVYSAVEDAVNVLGVLANTTTSPRPLEVIQPTRDPLTLEGYWEARTLLSAAGIAFPTAELVSTEADALAAAEKIGFPVVLKAMGLLHKSDVGGVAVGLQSAGELQGALGDMINRLHAPAYSVEAMAKAPSSVELIVGAQTDPRFGPVVMVGMGGTLTEVLSDVTFALAPVDNPTASRMLSELQATSVLHGIRGQPAVNIDKIIQIIVAVSRVAATHPEIVELELNPVLASPHEAIALDARIVLDDLSREQ